MKRTFWYIEIIVTHVEIVTHAEIVTQGPEGIEIIVTQGYYFRKYGNCYLGVGLSNSPIFNFLRRVLSNRGLIYQTLRYWKTILFQKKYGYDCICSV